MQISANNTTHKRLYFTLSRGEVAAAAHAAEISLNHVVMKFHRSDFTDDTVGVFSEQSDDLEPFRLPRTAREIHEPRKG